MKVITLNHTSLAESCRLLSRHIQAEGCKPSVIIGIKRGGAEVAQIMRNDFPQTLYCEVMSMRPDTEKKNTAHNILNRLPICICNWLRMAESRLNEHRLRKQKKQPARSCHTTLPADIDSFLRDHADSTVLLIDDAIDTGATIYQVKNQLERQYPAIKIKVAVITVTTPHPLQDADFCLYHDRTLCRFPWSNDYRPKTDIKK